MACNCHRMARLMTRSRGVLIARNKPFGVRVSAFHSLGIVSKDLETSDAEISLKTTDENVSGNILTPFATRKGLEEETDRLMAFLDGTDQSNKQPITSQHCYKLLEAWSFVARDEKQLDAARRAEELLMALEQRSSVTSTNTLAPTRLFYDLVLQAYTLCHGGREAAEHAKRLLEYMVTNSANNPNGNKSFPSTKSFNIVINCWAKSRAHDAGDKAEQIFRRMEAFHNEQNGRFQVVDGRGDGYESAAPNVRTLTGVVAAWESSGQSIASKRILTILEHAVLSYRLTPETAIELDVVVFDTVIHALARSEPNRRGAERAEYVLRMLEELNATRRRTATDDEHALAPTSKTYSMVLHAWSQCESLERRGDAAQRAEDILAYMVKLYRKGLDVKPSNKSFTTCIAAWARCQDIPNAPERAERLLEILLDLYKETREPCLKPDTTAGNAVITAWSRSRRADAPRRTEMALAKLKEFASPDLISYNSLLHSYSVVGDAKAASDLLEWLEDQPEILPDVVSYNCVLHAFAKKGSLEAAVQAEDLLERMERLATSKGRTNVKPNTVTYTSVINAWSNSNDPSPAQKAANTFQRMLALYQAGDEFLRPDVIVIVAVIQACARENHEKKQALKMALGAFDQIFQFEFVRPNELAFVTVIEACNNLSSSEEEWVRLVQSVFERCRQAGCVSKRVLSALRRKVSNYTLELVVGTSNTNSLPRDWSRNVPKRYRP
jgi:hypothetical protein